MMTRRTAVSLMAAAPLARASQWTVNGDRLYADVVQYWELGEHRTATPGDQLTSEWLRGGLRIAGLKVELQPFTVDQWFPSRTQIVGESYQAEGFPLWPAKAARVQGKLGAEIEVTRLPYSIGAVSPDSPVVKMVQSAAERGAKAIVIVTEGPAGEVIALNYEHGLQEWPIPAMLMGPREAASLSPGGDAVFVMEGEARKNATATNVVGRLRRGKRLVVVSTPKSGWFRCAGERGPGIALWLALARAAATRQTDTSFVFTANSGHELHDQGMKEFRASLAPAASEVACWIHLGAGIATWAWQDGKKLNFAESRRLLQCTPDLAPVLAETFGGLEGLQPQPNRFVGELRHLDGYRRFGIAASHRAHHTPVDDPVTTGAAILEPVGRALLKTLDWIEAKL